MRERYARVSRDSQGGRNPRYDLEGYTRGSQRFGFLATPPEDEGIAALQPHHVPAAPRALDQHGADLFLAEGVYRFLLPDVEALGWRGRQVEQRGVGQVVVEDGIR